MLSNLTIVGSGDTGVAQRGMTLRRGTGADLRNVLLTGYTLEAIDIRDDATVEQVQNGNLSFNGLLLTASPTGTYFEPELNEKDDDGGFDEESYLRQSIGDDAFLNEAVLSPSAFSRSNPEFTPSYDVAILTQRSAAIPQGEFWDEAANYVGAIRPGSRTTWLSGWTAFPEN